MNSLNILSKTIPLHKFFLHFVFCIYCLPTHQLFAQGVIDSDGGAVLITFDDSTPGILNGTFDGSDITSNPGPGDLDSDGVDFDDDLPGTADIPAVFGNNDAYFLGTANGNVCQCDGHVWAFNVSENGVNWTLGITPGPENWGDKDDDDGQVVFKFINNSGVTFTAFRVKFDLYVANAGDKSSIIEAYLTTDVSTPSYGPVRDSHTTPMGSDGLAFSWRDVDPREFSVTSGVNVPNGEAIYLRFYIYEDSDSGNGTYYDEIAIDNIRIIGASTPDLLDQCIAPIALCKDASVNLNSSGNYSLSTSKVNMGSVADCGLASTTVSPNSFNCSDVGQHPVTLTITDIDGNSSSCSATVTVRDMMKPTASCQNLTVQLDSEGNGSTSANAIDNGSSDACGLDDLSLNKSTFDCSDLGNKKVILTVTDNNGRENTCKATVTVEDVTAPVPDITDLLTVTGECNATLMAPTATDNCAGMVTATTSDPTSYSEQGTYSITWTYDDGNGNTATQTQTVIVDDATAPVPDVTDLASATGECSATVAAPTATDNCAGMVTATTSDPTSYSEQGAYTVTWTYDDGNGNTATQAQTVIVNDVTAPVPDVTDLASATGECSATVAAPTATDNCAGTITATTSDPTSYSEQGTYTVTWTYDDGNGNTATQTQTVILDDVTGPEIQCQADMTVNTDLGACEATIVLPSPAESDNCTVDLLRCRYRPVDEYGNNISGQNWSTWISESSTTLVLGLGHWKVQWQAKDVANNQKECDFIIEVLDNEPPIPACFDPVITFNGEGDIILDYIILWNENSSTDNCSPVYFTAQSELSVSCNQIGSTVPVTVTTSDSYGNESSCIANVQIEGLPCGWMTDPNGIGCPGAVADYDPGSGAFDLTSAGCYDPAHYRPTDSHGFIQRELCGDGSITTQVTAVDGTGWAGISMRESNDPSAPMIQLMIDGTYLTRRELRQTAGNMAFAHLFPTVGKNWLRLIRNGNQFSALRSADGTNWEAVFIANIAMSNCIEIGLITMNGSPSGSVTGTFENVSLSGSGQTLNLATPGGLPVEAGISPRPEVSVFPNPFSDQATIAISMPMEGPVDINIFNLQGQQVLQLYQGQLEQGDHRWQWNGTGSSGSHLPSGTYLLQLRSGEAVINKKVVLQYD